MLQPKRAASILINRAIERGIAPKVVPQFEILPQGPFPSSFETPASPALRMRTGWEGRRGFQTETLPPEAMLDATRNPLKVIPRTDGTTQYRGRRATVVLDPLGHVITVWPQSVKSWIPAMSGHALLDRIKTVLWTDWDPISINQTDAPRDEYDSYATLIVRLLQDGVSESELATRLEGFAVTQMGLPSVDRKRCRHAARQLAALWR